jgi:hypothetical protein
MTNPGPVRALHAKLPPAALRLAGAALTALLLAGCSPGGSEPAAQASTGETPGGLGPGTVGSSPTPPPVLPAEPLVQQQQLVLVGSFRVPVLGTRDEEGLRFGGNALAYDAGRDSLFLLAHDWNQLTAEISVPAPALADSPDDLPRATLRQAPADALGGRRGNISHPPNPAEARIAGQLRVGDHLLVAAYHYYDAEGEQVASHFSRGRDLSAAGAVRGPVRLAGPTPPRWLGGYMGEVPPAWQGILGGAAFTGLSGIPIAGNASNGPTLAVFDPQALIDAARQPAARLLVGYPVEAPLAPLEHANPTWNLSSELGGAVFVAGTRSVLFFGRHGTGPYCYGTGARCNDPVKPYQGTHGYPYEYRVWAYDAADLAAAARGEIAPQSLRPYAIWPLTLPFERDDEHRIGGVAHDPATGRIFLTQREGDSDGMHPLVHVLQVDVTR